MDKKEYKVKAKYTFNGTFFVKANTREEAKDLIKKYCGLKLGGGIKSIVTKEDIGWVFEEIRPNVKVF